MADVPSNLIPTRITALPIDPAPSPENLLVSVRAGRTWQVRAADLLQTAVVPPTLQILAGTGLAGGGPLSADVTLSIAPGGVGPSELASTGVTPGVYGGASVAAQLTVDTDGRVTAATNVTAVADVTNATGVLPLGNGGTGRNNSASPGALVFSDGSSFTAGPVGSAGQVPVSAGAAGYTWGSALVVSDQAPNLVYAGPASGPAAPTAFRTMVNADLPDTGTTTGTFGSATRTPVLTINAKGVVTAASSALVAPAFSSITGTPTTLAGYGIADGVSTGGSYANPAWLTSLAWSKISGTPTTVAGYGITDAASYAPVQSVFARTGAVVAAVGDYDYAKITLPTTRKIGAPTTALDLLTDIDCIWSSGVLAGQDLTDNGNGSVTLTAGTVVVRSSASLGAPLYNAAVPSATLTLTDNALNVIYTDYNSGAPALFVTTNVATANAIDKSASYAVYRQGTLLHSIDLRKQNIDTSRRIRTFFLAYQRFIHAGGGTVIGASGLNITVTAGTFYLMINPLPHTAFDTSVAGTANANVFDLWYRNGAGAWTTAINQKVVDTTTYDNNTGTPVVLGNNHYGVTWFYVLNNTPSELHAVMGQADYANLASAQAAAPPASIPGILSEMGSIIGVVIYQKAAVSYADIRSAFTQTFASSTATAHNALAGIQGGALNDYYHLTSAEYTGSGTGVFARVASPTFTGSVGGIAGGTF